MIDPGLARTIKLVGFDVDGVMTDGGIYLGAVEGPGAETRPFELKRYEIQDGLGIAFLRRVDIRVVIATGRVSESVRLRARELGVEDVAQDPDGHKLVAFRRMLDQYGIDPRHAAFVGDDFPDLPILRIVGLPVAVGNAIPEVRQQCRLHLSRDGGYGAVREFVELLLKARGEWERAWHGYVDERSALPGAGG